MQIAVVCENSPLRWRTDGEFWSVIFVGFFPENDIGKYVGITNKRNRFLCNIYRQTC